ncbi:unnamed protein product [Macrosiphum euphorbiae]|uniref:Uncharacterized protein n=1 Tax=Macrosiphum euphorbiae TaxID=13131 RepID=A0AAV0VM33_9HEMI|nr:unnamed protein product [Macrosiphum euphorbiae]
MSCTDSRLEREHDTSDKHKNSTRFRTSDLANRPTIEQRPTMRESRCQLLRLNSLPWERAISALTRPTMNLRTYIKTTDVANLAPISYQALPYPYRPD